MFAYPKQTELNRLVPKTKIYAHARLSKSVRDLFVSCLDEITWKNKISPETIRLPAKGGINEIEVFELSARSSDLGWEIIDAIDRAIPLPILFQITHAGKIRFAATYKRPSVSDSNKWVVEGRFMTTPQKIEDTRLPLPVSLDLESLYRKLVQAHIPLPARAGETTSALISRFQEIETKRREHQLTEAKLRKEPQFNKKVQLNAQLRSLSQALDQLTRL
jgi:hypothetical protein